MLQMHAIYDVYKESSWFHASKQRQYEEEDADILRKAYSWSITKEMLKEMLAQYVEKVDYELALEYATQSGVNEEPRETVYIRALEVGYNFSELRSSNFVFRLVQ